MQTATTLNWDPWNREIFVSPHATYKRLRDEAPLYYNSEHDFYALTRFRDVESVLVDRETFISGRGAAYEVMKSNIAIPEGLFIYEDAPRHTMHRARVSRVFTPRAVAAIEDDIRAFCKSTLDELAGRRQFDWAAEFAAEVPMRVIGMLLGIPEQDQTMLRDHFDRALHSSGAQRAPFAGMKEASGPFNEYIDWRLEHPSDDLMTQLLYTEFEDETGQTRRLTRKELLTYLNLLAAAGNDTTGRMIGWTGKLLADFPDQRRVLVDDSSLIPNAIEEILRFEPPIYAMGRFVTRDVELHDQEVPAGSVLMTLVAAGNRDDRHFGPEADEFDVRREVDHVLSFGYGPHFCLGASLARLELRIALEEVLRRMPTWEIDMTGARMADGYLSRGWETLPLIVT